MSKRTNERNKVIITSKHTQDILGKDSPGVGSYYYNYEKLASETLSILKHPAAYSFGSAPKFQEYQNINKTRQSQ